MLALASAGAFAASPPSSAAGTVATAVIASVDVSDVDASGTNSGMCSWEASSEDTDDIMSRAEGSTADGVSAKTELSVSKKDAGTGMRRPFSPSALIAPKTTSPSAGSRPGGRKRQVKKRKSSRNLRAGGGVGEK